MFHILKQKFDWILIFYYVFRDEVELMPKAGLVQPIVYYVQVNFPLYLFAKLARCQKIFFLHPRGIIHELLLKISLLRKVYTVEPILVKGLNKIAGEIIQSFCFLSLMYSITWQRNWYCTWWWWRAFTFWKIALDIYLRIFLSVFPVLELQMDVVFKFYTTFLNKAIDLRVDSVE